MKTKEYGLTAEQNETSQGEHRPTIIAHRGCGQRAPENTLRALRLAIATGIPVLEVDVRGTKDGVPVLLHDATLERTTTGWGRLQDWTFEDLRKQVDSRATQSGRVPSLADALDVVDGKATLAIEIKDIDLAEPVVNVVRAARAEDRVEIWSFHSVTLQAARELAPELPRVHLARPAGKEICSPKAFAGRAWEVDASAVAFQPADVTDELIRLAHDLGLRVIAGTVEDVGKVGELAAMGVDALTSDDPLALKQAFDEASLAAPSSIR
jgi:glycerophosphoryl diester phosphodiesterase